MRTLSVPYFRQRTDYWCGPAVLQMILACFGIRRDQRRLAGLAGTNAEEGTSRSGLLGAFRSFGLVARPMRDASFTDIARALSAGLPVIVNYVQDGTGHFSIITGLDHGHVAFNGPWHGKGFRMGRSRFTRSWNERDRWMLLVHR